MDGEASAGGGERRDVEGEDAGGDGHREAVATGPDVHERPAGGGREPVDERGTVQQVADDPFDGEQPGQHDGNGDGLVAEDGADGNPESAVQRGGRDQPGRDANASPVTWTSTPLARSHGTAIAADTTMDSPPISAPVSAWAASFGDHDVAATRRREERRRDRLMPVSPAMPSTPSRRATSVMTAAGPPMTWVRRVWAERFVALLPRRGEDGDRDESGDDRHGGDAGDERAESCVA